jgi:hypothetical protein
MHITARQEQFSKSAVFAIASRAGCAISLRYVDDDSVDLTLCSKLHSRRPSIDVQLKCTFQDIIEDDFLKFPISRKNYDDLRTDDILAPRILLVFLVPAVLEDWIEQTEDEMLIRKCGYWFSLKGFPPTINTATVTLSIPRTNRFTIESLETMMFQVHNGEDL